MSRVEKQEVSRAETQEVSRVEKHEMCTFPKTTALAMNRVAMARYGPILNRNEAAVSRKVFKYLPGPRDAIFMYFCVPRRS
jgi:hypothetical protein